MTRWRCEQCGYTVPVCRYWRTHGASPGEPSTALDQLAIEVYVAVQEVGWEMVRELRTFTLTQDDADGLLQRVLWLGRHMKTMAQRQE